jgi:hypothetical protein
MYNSKEVKYHFDVKGNKDLVVVLDSNGYSEYMIARKSDLVKLEDSYEYKRARERTKELKELTQKAEDNLKAIADKVVDRALSSLASRIKFNTMFADDTSPGQAAWAVQVTDELKKMIKEEAPKAVEKKDPFA